MAELTLAAAEMLEAEVMLPELDMTPEVIEPTVERLPPVSVATPSVKIRLVTLFVTEILLA